MISLWPTRMPRNAQSLRPEFFRHGSERMRGIAAEVAAKHGLTVADLRGVSRTRPIAHARQEAYAACYALRHGRLDSPYSFPAIGRFFGGRDHTTVQFGVKAHEKRRSQLPLIPDVQNGYETMKAHEG